MILDECDAMTKDAQFALRRGARLVLCLLRVCTLLTQQNSDTLPVCSD